MSMHSRRTGLIAKKVGMTQIFDESGNIIPVTLLKADSNVVVYTRTQEQNGYDAVGLGYGSAKPSRKSKSVRGICAKASVDPVQLIKEFRVSKDCLLEKGLEIGVNHFIVGQKIDIKGVNIGKGFAGGMKRHNFRGLEASHGVSVSHRSHGSTGNRQDPGRTFPGKKMAGHLGTETVTIQNILISAIDLELGIIAINGSVPGKNGSVVYITDAIKVIAPADLPFPAQVVERKAVVEANLVAAANDVQNAEVKDVSEVSLSSADEASAEELNEPKTE